MSIREAHNKDAVEITKMYRKLYGEEFSEEKIIPIDHSKIISKIFLSHENETSEMITGFIWITIIEHGESRYGQIEELFVKPGYRKKEYGGLLVEKAKKFFTEKSIQAAFVSVDSIHDTGLINFYTKQDFHICKGPWYYFTPHSLD